MARRSDGPARLLCVDKPIGLSSFDVVRKIRRIADYRRVGHAGTLDPFATGLLVLGLGAATRLLPHLGTSWKTYHARIEFGRETDTGDPTGEVVARGAVDRTKLADALAGLTGVIEQIPPRHSAVKIDGQRSYARARAGEEFEVPARTVTVDAIELLHEEDDAIECRIRCSSGTYVRSLARDLGRAMAGRAVLVALRREAIGHFSVADASTPEELERSWAHEDPTLDPAALTEGWPRLVLDDARVRAVRHGQQPEARWWNEQGFAEAPDRVSLQDERGQLVAVALADGPQRLRLATVLATSETVGTEPR